MTQTILIILGIVIAVFLLSRGSRDKIVGICSSALDQTVRKSANKEKIMALFEEAQNKSPTASGPLPLGKGELSNSDIREALGVSERSIVRYMNEFEKEGRVEQIGSTGRGVLYRLK